MEEYVNFIVPHFNADGEYKKHHAQISKDLFKSNPNELMSTAKRIWHSEIYKLNKLDGEQ